MKNMLFIAFCTLVFSVFFAWLPASIVTVFIYGPNPEINILPLFAALNIAFSLMMTFCLLRKEPI